eukprot:TRINITY_DN3702_c0_g1_i2.p1 TRINITY_DN3702_c0_g1~~TRINITY_DN3702_c0_g1_i2.p1  ORF type:complete len:319 (-),score=90.54 TRINITY_DN3702_c0_g1_i2:672-1628(-)
MEPKPSNQRDLTRFAEYIPLEDNSGFQLPDGKTYLYSPNGGWTDEYNFHYSQQEFLELRFQEYALLENELGFVTKDGDVFYFNENGGWEDEEGNLFDSNGKWIGQNEVFEQDVKEEEKQLNEDDDEQQEEEWKQYEGFEGEGEFDESEQVEIQKMDEKIDNTNQVFGNITTDELHERVLAFEKKKYVPVHFYYPNVKVKSQDILDFFTKGHEKDQNFWIADILFDYLEVKEDPKQKTKNANNQKKKTGYGIIQCMNQYTALISIKKNNQKFKDCPFKLFVESLEDYEKCFDIYNEIADNYQLTDIQHEYVVKYDPGKQ